MAQQPDINGKMRAILIDWFIDVHARFKLRPETLHLAVNLVDRFLVLHRVPRHDLQLVGIAALFIACKHEEI
jgi:G2/mitotic-specific cyclin-B, other